MYAKRERTYETYMRKISVRSRSYVNMSRIAIGSFLKSAGGEGEIAGIMGLPPEDRVEPACDIIQDWVNGMHSAGKTPVTIRTYLSAVKSYLTYRGMRITAQEYRMIDLPRPVAEEMHPLSVPEITRILDTASYRKKGLYLALLSSGMRIGEAVQVRRRDVRIAERVTIRIPAENTKTRAGRTVYVSSEAARFLTGRLRDLADGDLVWGTNPQRYLAVTVETACLASYLGRCGLDERYGSGTRKITLHSFRAYFFTKAVRAHGENYAHRMTGHKGYLMQYDRLDEEERLEMYIQMEPDLLIYDQSKNEEKIRRLKDANRKLADQAQKLREQDARLASLERAYHDQITARRG